MPHITSWNKRISIKNGGSTHTIEVFLFQKGYALERTILDKEENGITGVFAFKKLPQLIDALNKDQCFNEFGHQMTALINSIPDVIDP